MPFDPNRLRTLTPPGMLHMFGRTKENGAASWVAVRRPKRLKVPIRFTPGGLGRVADELEDA
jgi:hypothetical protein